MSEVILNESNFEEEVFKAEKSVLVDFFATWCGPCQMLSPVIEELAKKHSDKIKVGKLNVDDAQMLAVKYGVLSIPTLIVFKDGEVQKTVVGFHSLEELEKEFGLV